MDKEQLAKILADHKAWLNGESGGFRANLSRANLRGAIIKEGLTAKRWVGSATRGLDSYVFHAIETDHGSDELFFYAGCRAFTRSEFNAHIEQEYPETDKARKTMACLDYLESLRIN